MKSKEEEEGDGGEGEGQKGKRFKEKLKRGAVFVGHRRQPSTPVHISFNPSSYSFFFGQPSSYSSSSFSSRKLAASLWEFYHYYDNDHHQIPTAVSTKMYRAPYGSAGPSNNRRFHHGHGKAAVVDNNGLDLTDQEVSF